MEPPIYSFCLYLCILTVVIIATTTEACPVQCACSAHQVDCYGRNLGEIPQDLPETSVYVDFQDNLIKTIRPERLSRLPVIENLILRHNRLTRLESGSFANLTTLKRLQLGGNEIDYIDPDAFVNLASLQVLDLSNNRISNITGMFANVRNIERLVLTLNDITELTDSSLAGLEKLQYLILARNKITSISDNAFSNLNILSYLVLRGNPLKEVDKLWSGLHVLSFMDMSDCQLSAIPKGLPWSLSILRLGNNSIKMITSTDLRAQRYLGVLYIENNLITEVQYGAFSYCPHLSQVNLSGNKLLQLPDSLPANIESLNADNNNIRHIFITNFDHDSRMQELSLKNNSITDLAANTFHRLNLLTSLDLDDNDIRILYNMTFLGLQKLQTLSLDRNPIREIQFRALAGMPSLIWLKMSELRVNITNIKGNFFRDAHSLTTLDLHRSPYLVNTLFEEKEFIWAISSVKYLNIMDNDLEYLSTSILMALPALRSLKATENPWRCNSDLIPLRKWMAQSPRTFRDIHKMICESPPNLQGKSLLDISLAEFNPSTTTTTTPFTETSTAPTVTTPSYFNSTMASQNTTSSSPQTRTTSSTKTSTQQPSTKYIPKSTPKSTSASSSSTTPKSHTASNKNISPISTLKTSSLETTAGNGTPSTSPEKTYQSPSHTTPAARSNLPPASTAYHEGASSISSTQITTKSTTGQKSSEKYTSTKQISAFSTSSSPRRTASTTTIIVPKSTTHYDPTETTKPPVTYKTPQSQSSTKQFVIRNTTAPTHPTSDSKNPSTTTTTDKGGDNTMTTPQYPQPSYSPADSRQGGRQQPSLSSPSGPQKKHLIIGITASLLFLVVAIAVIVVMVSYHRRKKKVFFVDHDVSFSPNQEEFSDTVCIINHLQDGSSGQQTNHNNTEQNQSVHSKNPYEIGKGDKKTRKSSSNAKSPIACVSPNEQDDTDMLMDSWS